MANNIIARNIVVAQQANTAFISSPQPLWRREGLSESNNNLYWNARGRLNVASTTQQRKVTPEGNFERWQAAGFDRDSIVADPMFEAADRGYFRLKPNSPAFRIGFEPIPVEKIGPKGFTS